MRFLPAATPTAERMEAVLAQVHKATGGATEGDDLDLDPALACASSSRPRGVAVLPTLT